MAHPIAIGEDGRVYVADPGGNEIDVFDREGNATHVGGTPQKSAAKGLPRTGIAVDAEGRIYISEQGSDQAGSKCSKLRE